MCAPCSSAEVGAEVVAQRLRDLLLAFPAASIGGVEWRVLALKYEQRHATTVDVAAVALLGDIALVAEGGDPGNPVLVAEDAAALLPQPRLLGTWPSLYRAVCDIVCRAGREEAPGGGHSLLLSQLRPLIGRHWHASFDESVIGYFRAQDGGFVGLKKIKYLLRAMLRWREDRLAWRRSRGLEPTAVDVAVAPVLEVAPSTRYNDLVVICRRGRLVAAAAAGALAGHDGAADADDVERLRLELGRLREENGQLRMQNRRLQEDGAYNSGPEPPSTNAFDDPSEPPPEANRWHFGGGAPPPPPWSRAASTVEANSTVSDDALDGSASGSSTPAAQESSPQQGYVLVWLPMLQAQVPWSPPR